MSNVTLTGRISFGALNGQIQEILDVFSLFMADAKAGEHSEDDPEP